MAGTDTAAMIPGRFDIIIDGYGYLLSNTVDQSLPFRVQRAAYSSTPTFLERTNVGAAYGDDQQAFWLTASQHDFSLGEGQSYYDPEDADKSRRYFDATGVYTSEPGRVSMRATYASVSSPQTVKCMCPGGLALGVTKILAAGSTNLFTCSTGASVADNGAHGAGTPHEWGMCNDGKYAYISGTSKIRKWDGASFTDFASVGNNGSIAFLNNTIYTCDGSTLCSWSGAGVKTVVFTWKDGTNTAYTSLARKPKIIPFGGKLLIFMPQMGNRAELWQYDGTGTTLIAALPEGSVGYDIVDVDGLVFMGAQEVVASDTIGTRGVVYLLNGTDLSKPWTSWQNVGGDQRQVDYYIAPSLGVIGNNLMIFDPQGLSLYEYNIATGSIQRVTDSVPSGAGATHCMGSSGGAVWIGQNAAANGLYYPSSSSQQSTAYIVMSAFDFKSSRLKLFRGVTVDWTGSGSVNIKYAIDTDGVFHGASYTTLQTGATSGQEYTFPVATSGKFLLVKIEMVAAVGSPTLRRVYARAAPTLQQYKMRELVLDLSGRNGLTPLRLRDGSDHTLDGLQMATNLLASAASTTPISVSDRFGTFNGLVELDKFDLIELRPEEFLAHIQIREA